MALANYELKFELIKQELILLQEIIQKHSDITFKIKGWAITIFSAFSFSAVARLRGRWKKRRSRGGIGVSPKAPIKIGGE